MPIIANKVEGFPKEKVFYLTVEDNEMSGFRLAKGDLVLSYQTSEVEKDAIYLLEHGGRRMIRQIKKLDHDKLLLVGNNGSLSTDTVMNKEAKVLARLIRLEIML